MSSLYKLLSLERRLPYSRIQLVDGVYRYNDFNEDSIKSHLFCRQGCDVFEMSYV